jgi:tryptophanyl-tRNA synthetase
MLFNQEYYRSAILNRTCGPHSFGYFDFSIGSLSQKLLSQHWLCHANGKQFAQDFSDGKSVIITTGFGLTGVPHVGTIAQIMRAIRLQRSGVPVQIVLGDLDAFNGKNFNLDTALALIPKFRNFILNLGFDDKSPNILRTQYDFLEVLRDMYISGNFITDSMFENAKEDVHDFYSQRGKIDEDMTYQIKLSLNLMVADFFNLGMHHGFDSVMVFLGFDEYKYVALAMETLMKMQQAEDNLCGNFNLSGIFSSTMQGFNGFPKMGKSLPGSGIFVEMLPDVVCKMITEEKLFSNENREKIVYQMISDVSYYDNEKISEIYQFYTEKGEGWRKIKEEYVEHLIGILSLWS